MSWKRILYRIIHFLNIFIPAIIEIKDEIEVIPYLSLNEIIYKCIFLFGRGNIVENNVQGHWYFDEELLTDIFGVELFNELTIGFEQIYDFKKNLWILQTITSWQQNTMIPDPL